MRKRSMFLTTALLLAWPLAAGAAPSRDQVELTLSGIEHVPGKAALERLGPGVDEVLRDIALKPSAKRMLAGTRAITLLRLFPSKKTNAALLELVRKYRRVKKPGVQLLNLQQALTSYAVVAGPGALKEIEPLLAHVNVDVRYAACEAARLSKSSRAITVLQRRQQLEQAPMVRHQLKRQIELITRPPVLAK
jgi:hypothetical protein